MSEWEGLARLSLAVVLGGAIGIERDRLDKPAGLRTHMLVALGAAMFMVISILLAEQYASPDGMDRIDPSRIGSTIVTGIGFLGGGIIFRTVDRVHGLTTAAGMWVAAAIGMASGSGYYVIATGGTVLVLVVLIVMRRVEIRTSPSESQRAGRTPDDTD
jgi:putative Mg2+ transporter-C (MgtC) family protein